MFQQFVVFWTITLLFDQTVNEFEGIRSIVKRRKTFGKNVKEKEGDREFESYQVLTKSTNSSENSISLYEVVRRGASPCTT